MANIVHMNVPMSRLLMQAHVEHVAQTMHLNVGTSVYVCYVQVIPAIEEAIVGMKVGGVRRLIVPQELGYPGQPPDFTKQGPTPGNFSVSPTGVPHSCVAAN